MCASPVRFATSRQPTCAFVCMPFLMCLYTVMLTSLICFSYMCGNWCVWRISLLGCDWCTYTPSIILRKFRGTNFSLLLLCTRLTCDFAAGVVPTKKYFLALWHCYWHLSVCVQFHVCKLISDLLHSRWLIMVVIMYIALDIVGYMAVPYVFLLCLLCFSYSHMPVDTAGRQNHIPSVSFGDFVAELKILARMLDHFCACTCVCVYVQVCMYICMCICLLCTHLHAHVHTCMWSSCLPHPLARLQVCCPMPPVCAMASGGSGCGCGGHISIGQCVLDWGRCH